MIGAPPDGICWQDVYAVEHIAACQKTKGKDILRIIGCHEAVVIARQDQVAKLLVNLRQDRRFHAFLGFYIDLARLVPRPSKSEYGPRTLWFGMSDGQRAPLSVPEEVSLLAYEKLKNSNEE